MRVKRTIRNCTVPPRVRVQMSVVCPYTWEGLGLTLEMRVRHCSGCDKDVHLCTTDAEAVEHARAGNCIAREEPDGSELPPLVRGKPKLVEPTEEQRQALTLSRRETGITTALRRARASTRDCPECGFPVPDFEETCYVCRFKVGLGM